MNDKRQMSAADVLKKIEKGEDLTWDDVRQLSEEELTKVVLHLAGRG